jgi:hypothetical protein
MTLDETFKKAIQHCVLSLEHPLPGPSSTYNVPPHDSDIWCSLSHAPKFFTTGVVFNLIVTSNVMFSPTQPAVK